MSSYLTRTSTADDHRTTTTAMRSQSLTNEPSDEEISTGIEWWTTFVDPTTCNDSRVQSVVSLQRPNKSICAVQSSRLTSLVLGFLVLGAVAGVVMVILDQNGFSFRSESAPVATVPGRTGRTVSAVELAAHNARDDCWVVFHDKVYQMEDYAFKHPVDQAGFGIGAGVTVLQRIGMNIPSRS